VPLSLPSTLNRPALAQSEDDWAEEEDWGDEDWGDEGGETEALPTVTDPDEFYQFDDNPLNPLGNSLDLLIQTQINADLWAAMLGDLPCLEPTQECIGELQNMAVENNLTLQIINERVAAIEERIDEARSRNQTAVLIDSFEPLLARYLTYETVFINGERQQRGFFDNLLEAVANPINAINEALSLVGIPLIRGITRTNARAQQTAIAIGDLQVKVAAIEADARKIDQALREEVTLRVIDFDATRREFQIAQEIARRATVQHQLLEVDYRFGNLNSQVYLSSLNALDQQKAQTYRAWARMRSQMSQLKMLVLGVQGS
jgi:hypothetical protein